MGDDKAWIVFVVLLWSVSFGFVGSLFGIYLGLSYATKEATITCIEQPKVCKTKYDYYKLSDTKHE